MLFHRYFKTQLGDFDNLLASDHKILKKYSTEI